MNTNKSDKLRQCITLLNTVADCLDELEYSENADHLDFIISDIKYDISLLENAPVTTIIHNNGRFFTK